MACTALQFGGAAQATPARDMSRMRTRMWQARPGKRLPRRFTQ
jgi:hypothetical protein